MAGKYKLDGHKVVPSDITRSIRNQYNIALEEVKSIIDDDIKQLRICAISLQYRELLSLCNVIDRLAAELKSKSEPGEFIKFRQQIGNILNLKGILGEDIPPTEFILAEIDHLTAENKELTKAMDSLDAENEERFKAVSVQQETLVRLQAALQAKDEILKKYGHHIRTPRCLWFDIGGFCDCGFEQALKEKP